jgi:hypothetical protein
MSNSHHLFRRRVEDAVAALIARRAEGIEGLTFFKGVSMSSLSQPRIEVYVSGVDPEVIGEDPNIGGHVTGNMFGDLHVRVVASFADLTRDAWAEYCAAVEDVLMTSDLVEQLNNGEVSGLAVFAFRPGPSTEDLNQDEQVAVCDYSGRVYGCPSNPEEGG